MVTYVMTMIKIKFSSELPVNHSNTGSNDELNTSHPLTKEKKSQPFKEDLVLRVINHVVEEGAQESQEL